MEHEISQSAESLMLGGYLRNNDSSYNRCITDMFKRAIKSGGFSDNSVPLRIFDWAATAFTSDHADSVAVMKKMRETFNELDLNDNQQNIIVSALHDYCRNIEFDMIHKIKGFDFSQVILLLDTELAMLVARKSNEFDWSKTMQIVDSMDNDKDKLRYLLEQKTRFMQAVGVYWYLGPTSFGRNCQLEIQRLVALRKDQTENKRKPSATPNKQSATPNNQSAAPYFKWTGNNIDLIRVLNALYELKHIEKSDGQIPNKEFFMKKAGDFFGVDLSRYESALSQAMINLDLEPNLKVFHNMLKATQKYYYFLEENRNKKK